MILFVMVIIFPVCLFVGIKTVINKLYQYLHFPYEPIQGYLYTTTTYDAGLNSPKLLFYQALNIYFGIFY